MDNETITISVNRDAAHYLSMLLADQIISFSETAMTEQFLPMRRAYEHLNEEIERALATRSPTDGGASEPVRSMAG